MVEFKKILVSTDFSDLSASAFSMAEKIGRNYNARIHFLHIIPTLKYFEESIDNLGLPFSMEKDLYPKIQKEAEQKLNALLDEHLDKALRGKARVKVAPRIANGIADFVREEEYDLVVIASRGADETGLLRGSVTEKVIRHSEVPVFAITQHTKPNQLERIIFPTDGSIVSFTAFPAAVSLAQAYGAEITLLHVVELHGTALDYYKHDPLKSEDENIYAGILGQLETFLEEEVQEGLMLRRGSTAFEDQLVLKQGASNSTVNLNTEVIRGITAHHAIEEFAAGHSDMVAMTTHGHTGLAHFFLGSTTEQVVRHLDKPVLTVRPSKDKLN